MGYHIISADPASRRIPSPNRTPTGYLEEQRRGCKPAGHVDHSTLLPFLEINIEPCNDGSIS